jgi:acyl-CoA synthetase (AMP-forming)/AMP-acid ligase II
MNVQSPRLKRRSLYDLTLGVRDSQRRSVIADATGPVDLWALRTHSGLADVSAMRGKTVAIAVADQLDAALTIIALDGIARRILLCTDNVLPFLPSVLQQSNADHIISDRDLQTGSRWAHYERDLPYTVSAYEDRSYETEWVLFTSGTTGQPKMALHTLSSLTGPLDDGLSADQAVWSTFYDIRRYGGLQILLRALLGGGSMVLSDPSDTPVDAFLRRVATQGVTHISGTPSHWRKALMCPAIRQIDPRYVRLSGEIADQAILNHLQRTFPKAEVAHAFASTEAGVAFDVRDGLAGFPASYIDNPAMKAEMRVVDGTLRIRSTRTASSYIGQRLRGDDDGFVDTGDLIERRGDRYYFQGRAEGVINVGGQKVFPEEIEAVLALHPGVLAAQVYARKSPVTGALVAADLVLRDGGYDFASVRTELASICAAHLAAWKIPVSFKQVEAIALTPSGKIARRG